MDKIPTTLSDLAENVTPETLTDFYEKLATRLQPRTRERELLLLEEAAENLQRSVCSVILDFEKFQRQTSKSGWHTFTLVDAYAPQEPLQYVIDGLFPIPSLSIIYGAPGGFKSLLLAALTLHVAGGTPCLGRKVTKSAVLWVDLDNGKRRTHERFDALGRDAGIPIDSPFYYISMPDPWLDAGDLDQIEMLYHHIIGHQIKMIVIDNLGLISPGADENSGQMVAIMGNLRTLSERAGAAIVLIHHQRKGNIKGRIGESLRGHSSIEAAIDLALLVERDEGENTCTIRSTKTRDIDVEPFAVEFYYEHKPGTGELASAGFRLLEIEDTTSDKAIIREILIAIQENPDFTQKQVIKAVKPKLQAGVNRIRSIYNDLKAKGKLNA